MKHGYEVRGYNDLSSMVFRTQVLHHDYGTISVAKPAQLEFYEPEPNVACDSTFSWDYDLAQSMFQAMWNAGYRPGDGSCGSEERTALKKHIDFAEHVSKALLDTTRSPK
jgi:hypothetical protein